MITAAAAPSFMGHELPAVTVPPALKSALSLERASGEVSGRMHSSLSKTFSRATALPASKPRSTTVRGSNLTP